MEKTRGIDKVYRKFDIHAQPRDFAYWQTQPFEKRLGLLEEIRREYHGEKDASESRLQSVYRIIDLANLKKTSWQRVGIRIWRLWKI